VGIYRAGFAEDKNVLVFTQNCSSLNVWSLGQMFGILFYLAVFGLDRTFGGPF
jgi:hypothetical protein